MKFRPDVTLYPARDFFPGLHDGVLVSEDFWHAMRESAGRVDGAAERAHVLACGAVWLAALHANDLREHPNAFRVDLINPTDPDPVPLMLSRSARAQIILGVLSDARPDRIETSNQTQQ